MRYVMFSALLLFCALNTAAAAGPSEWKREFPLTDFSKTAVDIGEILDGGPPRDGIPAIDEPSFVPVAAADLTDNMPVLSLVVGDDARAYPLAIMMWHEIVNDTVGGLPVVVTYCPLCNAGLVFERTVEGRVLDFGTTGRLRKSDLVMYDRQTESWWQQFEGRGIIGHYADQELVFLPARIEGFGRFATRHPDGQVLTPPEGSGRAYGRNPYVGYDSEGPYPRFIRPDDLPDGVPAMAYVVAVGDEAWSLALLRRRGRIDAGDLVLSWTSGAASALDSATIGEGRDIGNVVVQRRQPDGVLVDEPYDLTFAFVFHAFRPNGTFRWD